MSDPWDDLPLLPQHVEKLKTSGVSPEVARERSYSSAKTKARLRDLGFGVAQRRPPALVIPWLDVAGELASYQIRPDEPRMRDGRPVKYETPAKQHMVLDVPRGVRGKLDDPSVPLFITEGPIKADAAVSKGLCCVALAGIWGWRGTNDKGGKTVLADFEAVALNGRRVIIAFDSDAFTNPGMHLAMERLGAWLGTRGAHD